MGAQLQFQQTLSAVIIPLNCEISQRGALSRAFSTGKPHLDEFAKDRVWSPRRSGRCNTVQSARK